MTAPVLTPVLSRLSDALSVPDGGFSIDPRNGGDFRTGYAVAIHPDRERQIGGIVSERDVQDYVFDNADLLTTEGSILGGWRCPDTGIAYLDISTIVHDRSEALRLARLHNQVAVWDFRLNVSVKA